MQIKLNSQPYNNAYLCSEATAHLITKVRHHNFGNIIYFEFASNIMVYDKTVDSAIEYLVYPQPRVPYKVEALVSAHYKHNFITEKLKLVAA